MSRGGVERRRHLPRNIGRQEFLGLLRTHRGLDGDDRVWRHVGLAEGREDQARRLADPDRAARRASIEHWHGRHLGC